jgi:hypothetical protein
MAQFEGTIKDFTKFIGAYARLKVAFLAARYKKEIGICEDCGSPNSLEAAHIKGKGRALLIANILSEFVEDGIIRIELNHFEERFVDAHLPIESIIRILCKNCHRKYDKVEMEEIIATKENLIKKEDALIESIIINQMNKTKAMKVAHGRNLSTLTNANTIFSNITTQASWWLQPHNEKFKALLHIILNDGRSSKMYIFRIPANTIANPELHFKQRNDSYRTNCSDIYIPTSGTSFKEKNEFDFSGFLIDTISY